MCVCVCVLFLYMCDNSNAQLEHIIKTEIVSCDNQQQNHSSKAADASVHR